MKTIYRKAIVILLFILLLSLYTIQSQPKLLTLDPSQWNGFSTPQNHSIPRIIWTFWHEDSIPSFIQHCLISWQINKNFTINVLSISNLHGFIDIPLPPNFNSLSPALQSDWIRLAVLYIHGGVWIDATVFITSSIDTILDSQSTYQGVIYYAPFFSTLLPNYPVVESWFIASIPKSDFVTKWLVELDYSIKRFGSSGLLYNCYLTRKYGWFKHSDMVQNIGGFRFYLRIHIAAQKVMQIDNSYPFAVLDCIKGPYLIQAHFNWDIDKIVDALGRDWKEVGIDQIPVLIKIPKNQRIGIIKRWSKEKPHEESILGKYLKYNMGKA